MEPIQIVIVEDDERIAEIQQIFAEKISGVTVAGIAHTILEGEEMLHVLQPDLVLLDIFFPDGNGLELLWKIRRNYKATDIVLITAAKEKNIFQEALRGGVFDYILKPLSYSRFQNSISRYIEHRKKLREITTIDQRDVDVFLHQEKHGFGHKEELPKGIDPITLQKVTSIMELIDSEGINAQQTGGRLGVSRTTSRRYLEYLVATGLIIADLCYGTPGRPERKYYKVSCQTTI
ncbi:MAG: two-component system response regulator [Desulfotalea sp.]|nr:MAG: two-component system response regulator [Desulfotalea sp.]